MNDGDHDDHADGYSTNKQVLLWKNNDPVQVTAALNLPGFRLMQFVTSYSTSKTNTGEYSAILLNLIFDRETSHYLITLFVPVTMLVIVSWLSFFIRVKDQFLKTMIALVSLITLAISLNIWNYQDQPRVSYIKAIDVWLGTCVTFIFAALIESVIAYLLNRNGCERKTDVDPNDSMEKNVSYQQSLSLLGCCCFLI